MIKSEKENSLATPLLLPTVAFVVGCLAFRNIDLWVPLTLFGVCGALFLWREWSVVLIALAITAGGVRVAITDSTTQYNATDMEVNLFEKSNEWAQSQIDNLQLSPRTRNLASAMILGNREQITAERRRNYGVSGASHILAVSGLHISIIVIFLNLLFRPLILLPRGDLVLNIVMVALIWIYADLVGFSHSVVRSAIMFSVLQVAWISGGMYSGLNGLCVAVLLCVGLSPSILYSVSFQLSVAAVGAIFLWGLPLYYRFFGGGGALISALCIGICCSVATMPIVSHAFGYVAILGILFSPLFILCTTIIIGIGSVWIIFPLDIFSSPLRLVMESAALILEGSVDWVARQSWGFVEWRATTLQIILIYLIYIVITLLVWSKKSDEKK